MPTVSVILSPLRLQETRVPSGSLVFIEFDEGVGVVGADAGFLGKSRWQFIFRP